MKPLRKYPSIYKFQNGGFTEGDPPVKELPVVNLTATRADWEKQKELRKQLDKSQQEYNNLILDYGLSADDQKMFGFEDYQGGKSSAEELQTKINKLNESYTNTQNQFASANKALVDLRTAYPDEWNNKTVSDVISDSGLRAMQRLNREEKVNNSSYKDFYSNYGSLIDPNIKRGYGPGAAYSTKQARENWMEEGSADQFANMVNKGVQFGLGLAGGAATGLASKVAGASPLIGRAAPYATAPLTIGSKVFPRINPINTIGLGFGAHSGANLVDPNSASRQSLSKAYNNPTAGNILDATGNVTMDALGVLTSPGMGNVLLQGAKGIANTPRAIGNLYDDVATGSTVLSDFGLKAWKNPAATLDAEQSATMFNKIMQSDNFTTAEKAMLKEYQYANDTFITPGPKQDAFNALIKKAEVTFPKNTVVTRAFYNPASSQLEGFTGTADDIKTISMQNRPSAFSAGVSGKDKLYYGNENRIVLAGRNLKKVEGNFTKQRYQPVEEGYYANVPKEELTIADRSKKGSSMFENTPFNETVGDHYYGTSRMTPEEINAQAEIIYNKRVANLSSQKPTTTVENYVSYGYTEAQAQKEVAKDLARYNKQTILYGSPENKSKALQEIIEQSSGFSQKVGPQEELELFGSGFDMKVVGKFPNKHGGFDYVVKPKNIKGVVPTNPITTAERGAEPLMLMGPNSWLGRRLFGFNRPTTTGTTGTTTGNSTNAVTSSNTAATAVSQAVPPPISAIFQNSAGINPYTLQNNLRNYTTNSSANSNILQSQIQSQYSTIPPATTINFARNTPTSTFNTFSAPNLQSANIFNTSSVVTTRGNKFKDKIINLTNSVSESLTKVNEKLGAIIEKKLAKNEPTLSFQEMETEVNNLLQQGVGKLKSKDIGIKLIADRDSVKVQLQLKDFFNQPTNKIELEKLLQETQIASGGIPYSSSDLTQAVDEWILANSDVYSGILNFKQTGFTPSNRKLTEILSGKPAILPHNFNSYNNTGQPIKQGGLKRAGEFPFANWQNTSFNAEVAEQLLKRQGISQEYSKALNEVSKLNNQRLYSGGTGHLSQGAARYTKEFLKGDVQIVNPEDAKDFLKLLNDTDYLKKVNDFYAKWAKAPANAKPSMQIQLPELYTAMQNVNFMYKKMGGYIYPTNYAYGGSLAPNIPTYYNFRGTPIYRDTTALPFANGGNLDGLQVDPPDDPIKSLKELNVNEVSALIYETVAKIIERKKAEGKIKPEENLDLRGVVSQILFESGNAKSGLTAKHNNFGGLRATSGFIERGGKTVAMTNRATGKKFLWRAYDTPEQGLEAQIDFLLDNPRYRKAGVFNAKNTQEYLAAVSGAGYGGGEKNYARKVNQMANSLDKRRKKIAPEKLQTLIQNFTPVTNPVINPVINGASIVAPINTTANNTITSPQVVNPAQITPINNQQVAPTVTPQIINNTIPATNSEINNPTISNDFLSAAVPISEGSKWPSYYPEEPQWPGLNVDIDYKKGKGFYLPKMTNPEKWGYQPMFKKGNKKHYIPTPVININKTNYTNPIAKAVQYFTGYDPLYYSGYDKEVPFINEKGEEEIKSVHVPGELDKVGQKNWHGFEHPIEFQKGYSSIQDIFNRKNYNKEVYEQTLEQNRPQMQNEMQRANGGMIKRADGSYSKRGLWDNIRANAGSGKKPTASMLKQERIINSKKSNGGFLASGYGSSLGRYYNVGGNLNNSTDCEPGFIKDENGNCIPDYGCKGDTPCRETDQIQSYYNEAMNIPRQIINYGEQVAFDYNENNKDPRTYWKKAVDVSESGFPDPSCMGAAGALPRCVPTIKNYMKQFPRAYDFSNYKFTEATKNNKTAYNTVGTYRDPKFDEESKGNVKPGDIVNFMGGDHSPHAMTFAGWNNGKAEYLASSGYPGDFNWDASNVGSMDSPGRKAYVQRFDQRQYVNTMYGQKIKELEKKARNNPISSGPLYLQPLKPQFINQVTNNKP